jgi:hypothetical protein
MATNPQNTTNITFGEMYSNNVWGLGSSQKSVREKQFPATADQIPSPDDIWVKYRAGVLRGHIDGYTGHVLPMNVMHDGADHAMDRTFTGNTPANTSDVSWAVGGDPACPYTPSLTSPAAGGDKNAGFDYQQMPQGPNLQVEKANGVPVGDGAWGAGDNSTTSPDVTSAIQATQGGVAQHPFYDLGKWSS